MSNFITRSGSKTNDIKYFSKYLPMDIKNVVEPFGGSFAVIRDVYYDDKYNKFVNDMDPSLYYVYLHPEELKKGFEEWNKINGDDTLNSKEKKEKLLKKKNINNNIKEYIITAQVVKGVITKSKNIDDVDEDIKFMKKINFSHVDAFKLIDKFKYRKDTFIFLDPPYLFSNNELYLPQKEDTDMTNYYEYFYRLLNDKKVKAKIMLIINDLKILRWIYKDFIKGDYDRIYQVSKRKTKHLIITNY